MNGRQPIGYALLDRRSDRVVSSHHGPQAFERACVAAAAHELTGYLSVVAQVDAFTYDRANLRGLHSVKA